VVVTWGPCACACRRCHEQRLWIRVVVARGAAPRFRPRVRVLRHVIAMRGFCGTLVRNDDEVGCVPAPSSCKAWGPGSVARGLSGRMVVVRRCVSMVIVALRPVRAWWSSHLGSGMHSRRRAVALWLCGHGGAVELWLHGRRRAWSRVAPRSCARFGPVLNRAGRVKRRAYQGGSHTCARLVPRRPAFVCPIRSCSETKLGSGEEKAYWRGSHTRTCLHVKGTSSHVGGLFGRVHEMELGRC